MFKKFSKMMLFVSLLMISSKVFSHFDGTVWLGTVTSEDTAAFASQFIITFHADGTVSVNDSAQTGLEGVFFPFGTQQGNWTLDGNTLRIKTTNFNYPKNITTENPGSDLLADQVISTAISALTVREDCRWEGTISLSTSPLQTTDVCPTAPEAGTATVSNICIVKIPGFRNTVVNGLAGVIINKYCPESCLLN